MAALVRHKYNAHEVTDEERAGTFAARQTALELILGRLRAKTRGSFLLTGPRGAGKSTLVHMVRQCIQGDVELSGAWLPVVLPEEQIGVTSLRDLLSLVLEHLESDGVDLAHTWHDRCEAERNEEDSEAIAIEGLTVVALRTGKTLLVGVENLDQLFRHALHDERMQATLRRLLMHEQHLCLLATSVSVASELEDYDQPFWEYFESIPLGPLNDEQIEELLMLRARYEGNDRFLQRYGMVRGLVRSINRLTGGNPRLVVMLYEVVSLGDVDSAVSVLRQLIDELTPLYNGLLDRLSSQHRKIVDAIMRCGGQASPSQIAQTARLSHNQVRAQLGRLKDCGCVNVVGGGKGRDAVYTMEDRLFATWYQVRYFRPQRRRIEMFVEVLREWFVAEERNTEFRRWLSITGRQRQRLELGEHLLGSLEGTRYYESARRDWERSRAAHDRRALAGQMYAADHYSRIESRDLPRNTIAGAILDRAFRHRAAGRHMAAIADYTAVIEMAEASAEQRARACVDRGITHGQQGRFVEEIADYTAVINMPDAPAEQRARAYVDRGITHGQQGRFVEEIADYTAVINMPDAPAEQRARAYVDRGITHGQQGRLVEEIADYTAVIDMPDAPAEERAWAYMDRGFTHDKQDRFAEAIADYTAVTDMPDAPAEERARAYMNRGFTHGKQDRFAEAIADYTAVIDMPDAPAEERARAYMNRGFTHGKQDRFAEAIADYTAVIDMPDAPAEERARAYMNRGFTHGKQDRFAEAIADYTAVIDMPDAPAEERARAYVDRGITYGQQDRFAEAIADYTAVIDMPDAPAEERARAYVDRGITCGQQDRFAEAIADYTAVIDMPDAPAEQRAWAYVNRGITYGQQGRFAEEIADYTAVIDMPDAPAEQRAWAYVNRGITYGQQGRFAEEIADYTAVIDMPDAPAEQRAWAYVNRGITYGQQGRFAEAIADYTAVIDMPDAPAKERAGAYVNRGVAHGQQGRFAEEIADYTAVIDMPDVPAEQRAWAYVNRGITYGQQGRFAEEIVDYNAVIEMRDAPGELRTDAFNYRSDSWNKFGAYDEAAKDARCVIDDSAASPGQWAIAMVNAGFAAARLNGSDEGIGYYRKALSSSAVSEEDRFELGCDILQESSDPRLMAIDSGFAEAAARLVVELLPVNSSTIAIRLLRAMAVPAMANRWPELFQTFLEALPVGEAEKLSMLTPVATLLTGSGEATLNHLPPEQRDFALEVFQRFHAGNR